MPIRILVLKSGIPRNNPTPDTIKENQVSPILIGPQSPKIGKISEVTYVTKLAQRNVSVRWILNDKKGEK